MSKCIRCGNSGLFLRVDNDGLCESCARVVRLEREASLRAKQEEAAKQAKLAKLREARLIALQNAISENKSDVLLASEDIVVEKVRAFCEWKSRIYEQAIGMLNQTESPDTFYTNVRIVNESLESLKKVQDVDANIFPADKPFDLLMQFSWDVQDAEYDMWVRCYIANVIKANKLKTEKGRKNRIAAYFNMAEKYEAEMGKKARYLIEDLRPPQEEE